MSALHIEPAHAEDAATVAALHIASWQVAYADIVPTSYLNQMSVQQRTELWRESILRGSPALLLARQDGHAVGFVSYGKSRDPDVPDTWGEIWALYVEPAHWAQGIGRALWLRACEALQHLGFEHVSLWVLADNERGIRFYRRMGLVPEAGSMQPLELGGRQLLEVRYHAPLP